MSEDELFPLMFSVESGSSFSSASLGWCLFSCRWALLRVVSFSCGFFHSASLGYASFRDGTRSMVSANDTCPDARAVNVSGDGFCFKLDLVTPIVVASDLVSLRVESCGSELCGVTSLTASLKDELTIDA